ncbi:MAG: hypothetical protein M1837_002477 [Sclerophora amabilis]|nr:MAG: hypothetical protein M1837_002477 [Sclerophora amabilis]
MDLDSLSPTAPARIRALLLPIGRVKRSRFLSFVDRLKPYREVHLLDVSPDGRPNRTMFSPLAFPTGRMIYDLLTTVPPESHQTLSPFELFREPLVIAGVADSLEFSGQGNDQTKVDLEAETFRTELPQLLQQMETVRERFPKALVHQLLLFDFTGDPGKSKSHQKEYMGIPPLERSRTTTMKTIMCDLSSLLLAEMTTFAKSLQGLHSIESPRSPRGDRWMTGYSSSGYSSLKADQPRPLSRPDLPGSNTRPDSSSGSPSASTNKDNRISMPAQLSPAPDLSQARAAPQSTSPPSRAHTPPLSTPDDISGSMGSPPRNAVTTAATRSSAAGMTRDTSRDRVSTHGFGSGSLSERARNKGKGRVGVVIGTLYLQAGRWGDATRELVESASIAKSNSDHLWHAKALENILVTMIMFAWAGMEFQIPQVCYPIADKSSSSTRSPLQTPSSSAADISTTSLPKAPNRMVSLQNLVNLLPDLLNLILNLYTRAATFSSESLPQIAYSEAVIRFSKLLTVVHLCDGNLNDDALQHVVLHHSSLDRLNLGTTRLNMPPTRSDITSMLFRALPPASLTVVEFPVIDKVLVYAGICSVLSGLGLRRKMALVMRELINALVPGLVQARKVGAAELGVHPAAGIAALNAVSNNKGGVGAFDLGEGDVEIGMIDLLDVLGRVYGVLGLDKSSPIESETQTNGKVIRERGEEAAQHVYDDSNDAVIARIKRNASFRLFGSQNLKANVLRSSINLCEALPDFNGVLRFTTDFLRTSGSGIASKSDGSDVYIRLEVQEQHRLASNISRTVSAARKLGLHDIQAEYWDEFLVRGVEIVEGPSWSRPIPHPSKELQDAGAIEQEKSPFIYNPFLKKPDTKMAEKLLVAGESAEFRVYLHNPYDFEVEIEHLKLESKGVELESLGRNMVVGAYRAQAVSVSGVAKEHGQLSVTGCIVKIKGCREQRFPIFADPWSPEREVKIKSIGLAAFERKLSSPGTSHGILGPKISSLALTVVPEQPIIVVKSTTLFQSALMVLEGETQSFNITLENVSATTPVDLVLFSFLDSTTAPMQAAMSKKDVPPADLYELELVFSRGPALRWVHSYEEKTFIAPGQTATFEVQVLGKPGLTSGLVQIDYSYLGKPREEYRDKFYTRQISFPVNVTVNASVELVRTDLLPLACDVPSLYRGTSSQDRAIGPLLDGLGLKDNVKDYCFMVLDLHNSWPSPLAAHLIVRKTPGDDLSNLPVSAPMAEERNKLDYSYTEVLQPGQVSRLILPLPRIFLRNPHAPIPTLNPANERQYVVSTSKTSPEAEKAGREAFWLREEILKAVDATWRVEGAERQGAIALRNIRLTNRMINILKLDDMGIDMAISGHVEDDHHVEMDIRESNYLVFTDEFFTLTTRVRNRTTQPVHPLLRLQPSLRHQLHNVALDISKFLAWNGLLQQALPVLAPGETVEVHLGFCVFCRGEYEIGATLEEVRPSKSGTDQDASSGQAASEMSTTGTGFRARERRTWHSRERCNIVARDKEEE